MIHLGPQVPQLLAQQLAQAVSRTDERVMRHREQVVETAEFLHPPVYHVVASPHTCLKHLSVIRWLAATAAAEISPEVAAEGP